MEIHILFSLLCLKFPIKKIKSISLTPKFQTKNYLKMLQNQFYKDIYGSIEKV